MTDKRILVLEPYYGGSHKNFLKGLVAHLPFSFEFVTQPARKWKWRMRFSAPHFAAMLPKEPKYDAVLCSTFVDGATLKGLGPSWLQEVPLFTYFHENQFVYPVQKEDERDFHFALTNLTTGLASDRLAFNSLYNLQTYLNGCEKIAKKVPDMKMEVRQRLHDKSIVLSPGIDFSDLDSLSPEVHETNRTPVIIWNHRWEHDKNPELFFRVLFDLDQKGVSFKLVVLGQSFDRQPEIFSEAQKRLEHRLLHFGYAPERKEYLKLLHKGDVVVSTARHEFFGISVIEAVRAGCRPLLPKRLSYPELFPERFLYDDDNLTETLEQELQKQKFTADEAKKLTDKYSWKALAGKYKDWLET